ncbi:MAG: hypothetical protein H6622_15725 [Halobacteriovoraceae bacterium]|nr:hypothetical protein [Halobacteriovoraceae bacterium]
MNQLQISLPTKNSENFGQFLSEILEIDFVPINENEISFDIGTQKFHMKKIIDKKICENTVKFEFKLNGQEIEDIKKRAEFFAYRFSGIDYQFVYSNKNLTVIDDCGRVWSFDSQG